jgi:hypothetical protein
MSETSNSKLSAAMVKAWAALNDVAPNATNPAYKSRYARLDTILAMARPVLAKNGLCIVQTPLSGEGTMGVRTLVLHESGERMEHDFLLPVGNLTPQAAGSLLTYCKRYCVSALLFVATDFDDDCEAAQAVAKTPKASTLSSPKAQPSQPPANGAGDDVAFPDGIDDSVDDIALSDWESFVVPSGKLAGKRLDELDEKQATWFCTRWAAKREDDKPFRLALNSLARAIGLDKKGTPTP